MKKRGRLRPLGRIIRALLSLFLAYFFLGAFLLPLYHREASPSLSLAALKGEGAGPERVLCIDDNMDALLWRLRLLELAREEIIYTAFEFYDDQSGQDVMAALYMAAERGVRVRLLMDGMSGLKNVYTSDNFKTLAGHPNVEMRLYNPIDLLRPDTLNMRMHDKYLIVDHSAYLLGGRNTNDLFLGNYGEPQNIDRELLVYGAEPGDGSSLAQLRNYFETIWALDCASPIAGEESPKAAAFLKARYGSLKSLYPSAFSKVDWVSATLESSRITLLHNPVENRNKAPQLWTDICALIGESGEALIKTPYVMMSRSMYRDLGLVCQSGASVYILTNAVETGANPWGCGDYLNQKERIVSTVSGVYEFAGQYSNHTKCILLGDSISLIGSYNMDMRSTYLDTELMLAVDSAPLWNELTQKAQVEMAQSRYVRQGEPVLFGEAYQAPQYSPLKQLFHGLFRIITVPLRHLL